MIIAEIKVKLTFHADFKSNFECRALFNRWSALSHQKQAETESINEKKNCSSLITDIFPLLFRRTGIWKSINNLLPVLSTSIVRDSSIDKNSLGNFLGFCRMGEFCGGMISTLNLVEELFKSNSASLVNSKAINVSYFRNIFDLNLFQCAISGAEVFIPQTSPAPTQLLAESFRTWWENNILLVLKNDKIHTSPSPCCYAIHWEVLRVIVGAFMSEHSHKENLSGWKGIYIYIYCINKFYR